jgi:hypothetical protein
LLVVDCEFGGAGNLLAALELLGNS